MYVKSQPRLLETALGYGKVGDRDRRTMGTYRPAAEPIKTPQLM